MEKGTMLIVEIMAEKESFLELKYGSFAPLLLMSLFNIVLFNHPDENSTFLSEPPLRSTDGLRFRISLHFNPSFPWVRKLSKFTRGRKS